MNFGYFTLSDNHYENNPRTPNQFVADITDEALYADQLGMHSAWIGEHHFNSLGVLSCPDLVLASIAARTKNIRLAPAVTVLPGRRACLAALQRSPLVIARRSN
jgi:alkanesulfonate monooxygenase SsuD/methylene tetrahydromethanopterin reductase-like flavin-dependent oxidoreductase (luciferase family)